MRIPIGVWLRRSSSTSALPAMIIIELVILFSRSGWNHEWDWAFEQASGGTLLLAPLLSGLVAHDRARRMEPTFALLAGGSRRGEFGILALALSSWLMASLAWLIGIVCAAGLAWRGGASGVPDPWIFGEALLLLVVASCVGLAIGSYVKGVLAGPLAAILVFGARIYIGTTGLGLDGALGAGEGTGSLVAERRTPMYSIALMSLHATIALLAVVVMWGHLPAVRRYGVGRISVVFIAVLLVVISGIRLGWVSSRVDPYEWITGREVCIQGQVTVCGPPKAKYMLEVADRSLSRARVRLGASGIDDWQNVYVLYHGGRVSPDRGMLTLNPEDIRNGVLGRYDVAATLAEPRACRELFGESPLSKKILADQGDVASWVTQVLNAQSTDASAPAQIREAYERIRRCVPMTDPW